MPVAGARWAAVIRQASASVSADDVKSHFHHIGYLRTITSNAFRCRLDGQLIRHGGTGPVGKYNPDWAILKHDDTVLYLVRETKGTKNFEKLRNSEAEKIRCGRRHFEALSVDFGVPVTAADLP